MTWPKLFRPRKAALSRPHDLNALKERLRGMSEDDPLWAMLLGLADAWTRDAVEACVVPGADDAEAHRLRGRVGMMLDFRDSLSRVWEETHPKPPVIEAPDVNAPQRM